jgi:hypothetical protein
VSIRALASSGNNSAIGHAPVLEQEACHDENSMISVSDPAWRKE